MDKELINKIAFYNYIELGDALVDLKNENEHLQQRVYKTIDYIDLVIELIKQQPTEDDNWILDRLNGFKYILKGGGNND